MAAKSQADVLRLAGTNMENYDSDLAKQCRETAAACEPEWKKVKGEGTIVWRIEKFKVVQQPTEEFGQFYTGDSYIVCHSFKRGQNSLGHDIHFWLGTETTIDEAGTAAYKTVELDDFLGGAPVQHREVQGHESDLFLSYFPTGIRLLAGGVDSGFRHVEPEKYQARLLQLKGTINSIRVTQVPLNASSLNSGDVFVLDAGLDLYQWQGTKSSGGERIKAAALCRQIDDERRGLAEVYVLEESQQDDDLSNKFWEFLGGKGPIKSAEEGGSDKAAAAAAKSEKKLFKLSDASGKLSMTLVSTGKFDRKDLTSDDVFVADSGFEVFVWIGLKASKAERQNGFKYAMDYLTEYQRPQFLPISRILDGGENEVWEGLFTAA